MSPGPARAQRMAALREAVGLGLQAIRAYKLRAFLTILGVVMGIMTVTGMSAIVAGLNVSMASQIDNLGASVIYVRLHTPGKHLSAAQRRRIKGLSPEEVELLARQPGVRAIAAIEPVPVNTVKYDRHTAEGTQVFGTTQAYETVHELYVSRGRFITASDVSRGARVAVLGADVADALFPFVDPLDKEISLDGRRFRVVGVMERRGRFLFVNLDNLVTVPVGSVRKRDPRLNFLVADVVPHSAASIDDAVDQVTGALRRARRLRYHEENNFGVFTQDTLTDLYRKLTGGIYLVMIAISSIGLLVGGVGVMNIMLVSVTERTREIGVRKALGARRRDVLWQFLTEAMTLTAVGGLLGILVGGLGAWGINTLSSFPAVLQPTWVVVALLTSMAVGLVFGLWPAAKAASLDPIEALRYE